MKKILFTSIVYCLTILACQLYAQPDVFFDIWLTGFSSPVDIENAGDGTDRLFIVQRNGIIKIIENDIELPDPFIDISDRVTSGGERGLLGLAFHPDYENNGYFFVNYTDNQSNTIISRFEVDGDDANLGDPDSEVVFLEIDQPFNNHNAGDIAFHPTDGYLYVATGDGGSGGDPGDRSQDGECLLGKMLRIDIDGISPKPSSDSQSETTCDFTSSSNYSIPTDNPFLADQNTLNEIWAIGLRNPWRFCFDSSTGDMWTADVGQNAWEEVNFEASGEGGKNYGWRCYEGDHNYNTSGCDDASNYEGPAFEYDHTDGWSITGGYVYRGSEFPNMVGYYIMADYGSDMVWALLREENGTITATEYPGTNANSISTFGVDEDGEMYAAGLGGTIYKIEDNTIVPVTLTSFSGLNENGINKLQWTTESEEDFDQFEIEKSINGEAFTTIGKVNASGINSNTIERYGFEDNSPAFGENYYLLKCVDLDGSYKYSDMITVYVEKPFDFSIYPNPNEGRFSIVSNGSLNGVTQLKVYSTSGEIILAEEINRVDNFQKTYDLSQYSGGIYLVKISSNDYEETIKLVIR